MKRLWIIILVCFFNLAGLKAQVLASPWALSPTPITATGFTANWTTLSGGTGYLLDVSTVSTFASFVTGYNNRDVSNVSSFSITGLTASATYYYRIWAYNASGISTVSNVMTAVTTVVPPVINSPTAITGSGFTVSWGAVTGASSYAIDVSPDPLFTSYALGYSSLNVGNTLSYQVTLLNPNTTYYCRVRTVTTVTGSGGNVVSLITLPAAPMVSLPTAITQTGFSASWTSVAGATNYYLDVATDVSFANIVSAYNNLDMGKLVSASITGLTANTTYYYRVRAYNQNTTSTSSNSNVNCLITLNGALPSTAPIATAPTAITTESFTANWGLVGSALGYYIDVSVDPAFVSFVAGYNNKFVANVLTCSVVGLTANTTYYYRVRAYGVSGTGGNGNSICLMTLNPPALLAAPVANAGTIVATAPHTNFSANWSVVPGATAYYLEVARDAAFTNFVTAFGENSRRVAALTFAVSEAPLPAVPILTANTTYYYRVWSANASGRGQCSNTISYTTLPYTAAPAAPVIGAATSVDVTSFNAVWTPVTGTNGATGYYLDVAKDAAFTNFVSGYSNKDVGFFYQAALTTAISYAVTGLTPNTQYYYRVRAYNPFGIGPNSSITSPTLSSMVATAATSATLVGFNANWNVATNATAYAVDVATDAAFTYGIDGLAFASSSTFAVAGGSNVTYAVTGLKPNTTYYYRVRATVSGTTGWTSANSNVITVSTLPITDPPAVPVVAAATGIAAAGFTVTWATIIANSSCYIDVATDNAFTSIVSAYNNLNIGNVTTYTVTNLLPNTTYYCRVRSSNAGGISANSNVISLTTLTAPAAPVAPVANAASSLSLASFNANWGSVSGTTAYFLDVATDASFTNFVVGFNNRNVGTVTTFSVTGLVTNTTYYYQVRAYNPGGLSANSNMMTITTLQVTVPVVPLANVATSAASPLLSTVTFTANWNPLTTASGYFLDVALDAAFTSFLPGFSNKDVTTVNAYTITGNGLLPNTVYYYRVRAYNSLGSSGNSNVISVTTPQLAIPTSAPVAMQVAATQTGFIAGWSASVNAFGYYLDVATDAAFVNYVPGYYSKNVYNTLSSLVTGLIPNTTYYYRVSAYNASGTFLTTVTTVPIVNAPSNVITVHTLNIDAPFAVPGTSVTKSGLCANWNSSATATGYYLDVATDRAFSFLLPAYSNIDVGSVLTYQVAGLTTSTGYFYRVRAYNATGTSPSSNIINATTLAVETGLAGLTSQDDVKIYASDGTIRVESTDNIQEVYVSDVTGKIISSGKYSSTSVVVNVIGKRGVYIVRVVISKGVTIKKLSIVL